MLSNCIKDLLGLKEVLVKNIKNLKDVIKIYIELPISKQTCPKCGSETSNIHDYYTQTIKDIPIQFKPTNLIYRKRRYVCPCCNKKFYENNNIVNKFHRTTTRLIEYVVEELRNLDSVSNISKRSNVSTSVISKMLPYLAVTNSKLPRVLCIDEFKGNCGKFKYQVALIDGETHDVVDILECRHKSSLCE